MAPTILESLHSRSEASLVASHPSWDGDWRHDASTEDFIVESWSEGFLVGGLIVMACITIANMRRGVLLHKLILLEQLLAMGHGTFCFMAFPGHDWYLSSTAALLYCSYFLHNVVAWMKIKPFFVAPNSLFKPSTSRWVPRIYLSTLLCTIPPLILQIYDNFRYFNNINNFYTRVRPYEPLMRDAWWVFTCLTLFHVIRKCYGAGTFELIRRSPRFGILLIAIILAMIFTAMDITASVLRKFGGVDGINAFWKLALVFKCLTDTIMLDDFKTELKRLGMRRIQRDEAGRGSIALTLDADADADTDAYSVKGEQHELEFSDVLGAVSTRGTGRSTTTTGDDGGGGERRKNRIRRPSVKTALGRVAEKIRPLPSLGAIRFAAIRAAAASKGKRRGREENGDGEVDGRGDGGRGRRPEMGEKAAAEGSSRDSSIVRVTRMRQSLGVIEFPGAERQSRLNQIQQSQNRSRTAQRHRQADSDLDLDMDPDPSGLDTHGLV